jgi:hypothetical protein
MALSGHRRAVTIIWSAGVELKNKPPAGTCSVFAPFDAVENLAAATQMTGLS